MQICDKDLCTGCTACVSVCPKECITMTCDEIGHFIPSIDEKRCISCGACQKVCHNNNTKLLKNVPQKAYAVVNKNKESYMSSSSGGAATVFSRYFIENNGVVYGCTGKNGYNVAHIRVDNIDDLEKLKGSKYVESRLADTFNFIKKDLMDERKVLFIGTPCQCAGAKSLFGENKNFYLIDLICHGVPSQKLLKEHLEAKCKKNIEEVKFREGNQYVLSVKNNEKVIFKQSGLLNLYLTGFNKSLFFRNSCYQCKYANSMRCTDITIGDFWGLKNSKLLEKYKNGISVVLPNTQKGNELFECCKELLDYEECGVDEAINGNVHLRCPSKKHKNSKKFRILYKKYGFKIAANRCLMVNRIKYLMLFVYNKLIGR